MLAAQNPAILRVHQQQPCGLPCLHVFVLIAPTGRLQIWIFSVAECRGPNSGSSDHFLLSAPTPRLFQQRHSSVALSSDFLATCARLLATSSLFPPLCLLPNQLSHSYCPSPLVVQLGPSCKTRQSDTIPFAQHGEYTSQCG